MLFVVLFSFFLVTGELLQQFFALEQDGGHVGHFLVVGVVFPASVVAVVVAFVAVVVVLSVFVAVPVVLSPVFVVVITITPTASSVTVTPSSTVVTALALAPMV